MPIMSYPYKTVLITGATSGLGLALAEKMIEEGIFVIAVGRREDRLASLKNKHGAEKVAIESYDMTNIDGMPAWVEKVTNSYPTLDSVILNAGIQHSISFANPESISLPLVQQELTTNYTAPLVLTALFLPHLKALAPAPASIVLVTSGLALVPIPRCANYCATKAAIRSLAMTLRHQLSASGGTAHIKVVEMVPPAVQTELHTQQPDLAAAGVGPIGLTIDQFMADAWVGLCEGKEEIPIGDMMKARCGGEGEMERKRAMEGMIAMLKKQGLDA